MANPPQNPVPLPPEVVADGENDDDARGDLGDVHAVDLAEGDDGPGAGARARGRRSNWQPVEIVVALLVRLQAQTEHGSQSKKDARYASALQNYAPAARAVYAFLQHNDAGDWPAALELESTIRERTQSANDLTGQALYRKGKDLKAYLATYTAVFARAYASANNNSYTPLTGDNDGKTIWATAEVAADDYNKKQGPGAKEQTAVFAAAALAFRLLCPQSPYNVLDCDTLSTYVSDRYQLDPTMRNSQDAVPSEKDIKTAQKSAGKAALNSYSYSPMSGERGMHKQLEKIFSAVDNASKMLEAWRTSGPDASSLDAPLTILEPNAVEELQLRHAQELQSMREGFEARFAALEALIPRSHAGEPVRRDSHAAERSNTTETDAKRDRENVAPTEVTPARKSVRTTAGKNARLASP